MLQRFAHMPKNSNIMINCQVAAAKGINIKVSGKNMEAAISNCLLPNLEISQPDKGRLINWPTGNANKTPPKAALLNCSFVLISGMRLAQLDDVIPAIKKNMLTAILWILILLFTDKEMFIK
jgi:hypothetical protein